MKLGFRMNLTRLFVDTDLEEQAIVQLNSAQSHYLSSVLRKKNGFELILFNGRDGGFLCKVETSSKRSLSVYCKRKVFSQTTSPDLWILFVPILLVVAPARHRPRPPISLCPRIYGFASSSCKGWDFAAAETCS